MSSVLGVGETWWRAPGVRGPAGDAGLQLAADVAEHGGDLRADEEQRDDHDDCDKRQEDAILGHRLAFLAAQLDASELEPITNFHSVHTSLRGRRCDDEVVNHD